MRVELFSSQNGMGSAQGDYPSTEVLNLIVLSDRVSVKPAHLLILTVRIIARRVGFGEIHCCPEPSRDK
jgi:hypothetical protein